jgi:outer membrane receptor protein involved in Fe transport
MTRTRRGAAAAAVFVVLAVLGLPATGYGQLTTATVSGTITDETGGGVPGATIIATNTDTGFERTAGTGADGNYTLSGLAPGSYIIKVTSPNHAEQSKPFRILVGQNLDFDFQLATAVTVTEAVTVTGEQFVETKTSEIATNVAEEQIDNLPQSNRNFLNFAILAPGVRINRNEFEATQQVASGALGASQTNVFIDGVSFKSDVLQGGVVGQDSSRGNPFPQNAVQEYQVLTQNFKAEYETAASAVISAVTKSGSNAFHGDAFLFYQDKDLVDENEFNEARRTGDTSGLDEDIAVIPVADPRCPGGPTAICDDPEYERFQVGIALGGPIVQDRAHFFLSYEGNRQDRAARVFLGSNQSFFGGNIPARFTDAEGSFTQPFRSNLYYGKLSFQPAPAHNLELSGNVRQETDIRGFGDQTSFESAENVKVDTAAAILKHQWAGSTWVNQAIVSYSHLDWNPTAEDFSTPGEEYVNLLRLGGRDTNQQFIQDKIGLRDDLSYFLGNHTLKGGFVLNFAQYEAEKFFNGNPLFRFRSDISSTFPFEARYGTGDPNVDDENTQFGVYIQDDWVPTPRLTVNAGLRWDYESNLINPDYVTPDIVRTSLAGIVDEERYFTDGDDRDNYYEAFAPRLGIAYDFAGNGRSVAHAGYGIYYDRTLYNDTLDERFRLQYAVRLFRFSADGLPRDGQPTIMWRPEYFSREGLDALIASGVAGLPEVFLIANDTEPLRSQQWSIGFRQAVGPLVADLTYVGIRSENGFTFIRGNRRPDGSCCVSVPNFSNAFISSDTRKTWYDAVYFTLNKPFSNVSKWGMTLAYTYAEAEQIGGDLFSLDFPTVDDYPRHPTSTDERHRFVLSALFGLPWGFRAGTLITLGSGFPYNITDESLGAGPNQRRFLRNEGRPPKEDFIIPECCAFRSVDLRLEWDLGIGPGTLGLIAEGFNIFDYENYGGFDGFIPTLPNVNANFGKATNLTEQGRRLQFGIRYAF